jgi:hypothetical protein
MIVSAFFRASLVMSVLVPLAGCTGDAESMRAFSDGYDQGGLLGAFASSTPDAVAERKRKEEARAAYRSKVCEPIAKPGTPAHEGCMLQMAEAEAREMNAVRAMRAAAQPVTCHKIGDMVTCN